MEVPHAVLMWGKRGAVGVMTCRPIA